jgi:PEGA domain
VLKALVIVIAMATVAHAQRVVAVAPLTSVGAEDTTASTKAIVAQLETAIAALPNTKVVTAAAVGTAIKRANKPALRACDLEPACLAEVGKLVGANVVIAGEVVGLGDAKVIYLGASETGKEARSTTLTLGGKDDGGGPQGAIIRLLEPDKFRGLLHFTIDAQGATIYVNGSKATLDAKRNLQLAVGTQAVRVTHPEYQDFVRFVDVGYAKQTEVQVDMKQYPIVRKDLQGKPINKDGVTYIDPPWYRRWYAVAGGAVVLTVVSAVVVGYLVHDLPGDNCRKVGGEEC